MKYFIAFAFVVCIGAQHISDNACPDRPIEQNFDIKKVSYFLNDKISRWRFRQYTGGVWYDVLRYDASFSKGCDCGFANYDLKDDNTVGVRNCCKRLPNTTLTCSLGHAILSEPEHVPLEGKISVGFGKRREFEAVFVISSVFKVLIAFSQQRFKLLGSLDWLRQLLYRLLLHQHWRQ